MHFLNNLYIQSTSTPCKIKKIHFVNFLGLCFLSKKILGEVEQKQKKKKDKYSMF